MGHYALDDMIKMGVHTICCQTHVTNTIVQKACEKFGIQGKSECEGLLHVDGWICFEYHVPENISHLQ
jgi:hypothetical protein